MKHQTTQKRLNTWLRHYPVKPNRTIESVRIRALAGFSVAMVWLVIIILSSKAI